MSTTPPEPEQPYGSAPPPPSFDKGTPPGQPYQHAGPPQPGSYPSGPLMNDSDQRMWATLGHLSGLLFGFLGPLVIYLVMKDKGHFIRNQALEALNFQITVAIAAIVSAILIVVVIGLFLLPVIGVAALVLMIMAAIAANRGEEYRYPLTLRLVN
ncbi:MAG TPA: DUF4870 domain-containing protein [Actinomycetales bacterium]|nr:DUF4870 domain-containing protein [Actinomycetales bacterium]